MLRKVLSLMMMALPVMVIAQNKSSDAVTTPTAVSSLLRGPYLQAASEKSIVIRWRTSALAASRVRYGTAPGKLTNTIDDNKLVTEHIIKLKNLTPHTRYYYAVGAIKDELKGDTSSYFYTLPTPGTEGVYRIGIFGDCGTNSPKQRGVRDQFLKYLGNNYMDAWILLGDNAYNAGTDAEYQSNFFNVYKGDMLQKYPLFPAPGNHDYRNQRFQSDAAAKRHELSYYENFTMPVDGESGGFASHTQSYYSYDLGNIHFLSLDSYGYDKNDMKLYDPEGEQVKWIKKDLDKNKNKGWVVAYFHHPPYTMGTHNSDRENDLVKLREQFIGILEKAGVDLIICGHSHVYERSKLMRGYYGMEPDFNADKYDTNKSTGKYDGSDNSCPYIYNADDKDHGVVYVVTGSAGKTGGKQSAWPHNAMYYSNHEITGASMLVVQGNRLDFKWICMDGVVRDKFTMMKNVNTKSIIKAKSGEPVTLNASFVGKYLWSEKKQTGRSIVVNPPVGKTVYTVKDTESCIQDTFEVTVAK